VSSVTGRSSRGDAAVFLAGQGDHHAGAWCRPAKALEHTARSLDIHLPGALGVTERLAYRGRASEMENGVGLHLAYEGAHGVGVCDVDRRSRSA